MGLQPMNDRVLVKVLEAEQKTKGGILLPDTALEKQQKGTIIAVGQGKINEEGKRVPLSLKKNDTVIFAKYAGTEVKVDDEEYLILREEDILAVVEK